MDKQVKITKDMYP